MNSSNEASLEPGSDADLLRRMVDEAEDVRRAISEGEVDAFVVGRDNNRKVLLLANAYQRYRQLVERMQQGAITVNERGNILYANQRFSDMLDIPLAQLYTAPLDAYVTIANRASVSAFLMLSTRSSRIEVTFHRRDGSPLPVRLTLVTVGDGYSTLLVTDQRPLQWPALTVDALDSIRNSLEKLNRRLPADPEAREALQEISEEINGLSRLIDEILDVTSARRDVAG
jgi:PAS domain S-box-containing protein